MRAIIAGSRTATAAQVREAMDRCPWSDQITTVVSGTAAGADRFGEEWARARALPINRYPADWGKHGRAAGPIRNRIMAQNADALVAVWDGTSRGTMSMIDLAARHGLRVAVLRTDTNRMECQ